MEWVIDAVFTLVLIILTGALNLRIRNLWITAGITGTAVTILISLGLEEHMGKFGSAEYLKNFALGLVIFYVYAALSGAVFMWGFRRLFRQRGGDNREGAA